MFTVSWRTEMFDRLADLYVAASPAERERMATAVEAFNRRLATRPEAEGESRGAEVRLAFIDLLAVRFRVDLMTDRVRVVGVRRYGR